MPRSGTITVCTPSAPTLAITRPWVSCSSTVSKRSVPPTRCGCARIASAIRRGISSPAAIAETKRLLYRHLGTGYVEALQEADASQWRFVTADDAREGAAALLEKRIPQFYRLGEEK